MLGFGLCSDIDMFIKMEQDYVPGIHGSEAFFSPRSRMSMEISIPTPPDSKEKGNADAV